jgi:membrane protein DedA with SNARE-associated domain
LFSHFLEYISGFIIFIISSLGYFGIVFCMTIESACIPLPSEIIMPFSGYLVFTGKFSIIAVTLAGAVGNLIGSIIAYVAGYFGGRPFVEKYGKYFLISHKDLDLADSWFSKYGDAAVFFSRMLPIIRTFISLPAGISKMRFGHFCAYTFIGAAPWCLMLAFIGIKLGENWNTIGVYFHQADLLIGILLIIGILLWVRRHFAVDG